jgi:hypothetical protein
VVTSLAARGRSRAGRACALGPGSLLSNLGIFPSIFRRFDASIPARCRRARPRGTSAKGCYASESVMRSKLSTRQGGADPAAISGKKSIRFSRFTPQRPKTFTPGVSMTAPPKLSG